MKLILCLLLLLFAPLAAMADQRTELLTAWENIQKSSDEVEYFEKIAQGKYKIKFTKMPYAGELSVLAHDIEDIAYGGMGDTRNPYEKMGYVEVELPDAKDDTLTKYGRVYYKWAQNNTLYLNRETGNWDSAHAYTQSLMTGAEKYNPGTFSMLFFEYWNYLLAVVIIYFVFAQIIAGRRVKQSIALQNKAALDVEKSRSSFEEALELAKKSNALLENILKELKARP